MSPGLTVMTIVFIINVFLDHCPLYANYDPFLQWWRRQWVVLDIVETLDTPALIGRIYSSHLHEDRTLPSTTVTLTDVHALHRMQSRQAAFYVLYFFVAAP